MPDLNSRNAEEIIISLKQRGETLHYSRQVLYKWNTKN